MAKATKQAGVKEGELKEELEIPALQLKQGDLTCYVFVLDAAQLWSFVSINRRLEDKDEGYQRVLSTARVESVANHIRRGKPVPNSILIALDQAQFDSKRGVLKLHKGKNVGWVIDGQHRLAGAHRASADTVIDLCVIALMKPNLEFQIEQFVTINREAKGVPTSLLYDLLKHLPGRKRPIEIANEKAASLGDELKKDKSSVFYERIVATTAPRQGQVSITNFVRKVTPIVNPEKGILRIYSLEQQRKIINNFFTALKEVYPDQWRRSDNIFFKTVGFGAMMNVFEEVFQTTISSEKGSFEVSSIVKQLKPVAHFEFSQWGAYGSGNKAELDAAQDFRTDFLRSTKEGGQIKGLRL